MKKILTLLVVIAGLALLVPAGASAKGKKGKDVNVAVTGNSLVAVVQVNTAHVINMVTVGASTGGNSQNKITGEAKITTGDATAKATVVNNVNTSDVTIKQGCDGCGSGEVATVEGEGVVVSNNDLALVGVFNGACIINGVMVGADTGDNSQSKIGGGTGGDPVINSGDAKAVGSVENNVNDVSIKINQ